MTPNAFKALSMAAALVVAGSSQAAEFEIDFESGTTLPATEGTWTVPTGDASAVVATPTGAPNACETQVLSLDTGDGELNYAPNSTDVTILEMDVCFVGADSAPDTTEFNGQTMLYLDVSGETPAVKAYTAGSGWVTLTGSVADGSWHTVRMEFSASAVAFFLDGTAAGTATLSNFTKVTSVGFKGTGMVDNFVGDKAGIPAQVDGTTTVTASVNGTTVTVDYGSQTGIQFIRVYNTDGDFVTLRTSSASATIDVSKLSGTIARVDAVTSGTATTGVTPAASAVAVDTTGQTPQISITVPNLVSGLYYTPVAPDGTVLAASQLIAPADDGESATFTVPASTDGWGVVKFKIVASDEALTNN